MPIQNFSIYTKNEYAGNYVDSSPSTVVSGALESVDLEFGVAVSRGASERAIVKGGDSSGDVYGVALREWNHEASKRPSDGTTVYTEGETVSVIRQGFVYVEVTARAIVYGELINVNDTTGAFTGGTAGAGETKTTNVRAEQSGSVGDVVKVRVDIV